MDNLTLSRIFTLNKNCYYSVKTFPRFWLVKATRIIPHNQLLLTKFGKSFVILDRWRQNDLKSAAGVQLPVWYWEQNGRTVGGTFYSFHGEILSIRMARTAWRRTTSAIWNIFADLNRPLSPKFPDKDALSIWEGLNGVVAFTVIG